MNRGPGFQSFCLAFEHLQHIYILRNFYGEERRTLDLRIILSILKQRNF